MDRGRSACQDSEGLWASVEVLLRTEGDEEDRNEALEAAKAMLDADGFPADLLEERADFTKVLFFFLPRPYP